MDWLRRNWPDLAIGVALVAVIGGIIATLLTGGTFFPSASDPADVPAPPPITTPAPAPTDPVVPAPDATAEPPPADAPAEAQPGVAVLAPDGSPVDAAAPAPPAAAPAPTPPAPTPPAPQVEAVAPDAPAPAAPAPAAPAPAAPAPAPVAPAPAAAAPAPSPAPAATGPLPSASADPEAPFRVSVGAFGNPDNAARQADTFRAAGFPVFTGTQGDLTIVLVGPYASEADAAAVAARIRGGDFGIEPVVYRFQPDAASPASATPAPAPAPAVAPTPTPTPTPAAAPAPAAGERYLQVGAFASAASAQPLRERLAGLGFATRDVVEDGLVKVLVGPFDDAGLASARSRLDAQGIQSFPR